MTWVNAIWLEVNNGETYEKKLANLLSMTMKSRDELETLIKIKTEESVMSTFEVMDWIYNYYLRTGELPE